MKGNRLTRVADLLRKEIARILHERLRDPRLGFITITSVEVASDLRNANVFVSSLGDDAEFQQNVDLLNHASPYIRTELKSAHLGLRNLPAIRFKGDRTLRNAARIQELLLETGPDGAAPAPPETPPEEN